MHVSFYCVLKQNIGTEMATPQKIVLRVHIATDVAMKLTLNERPKSVEELKSIMKEKFKPKLNSDFDLQYEDPDFDGQLSVLVDMEELPEKGTLKVVRAECDESSTASSDTDILPHAPLTLRQKSWPDSFPVPTFSFEVEHVLEEGNRSGKPLILSRAQKHNILEKMAETMHSFKPYPNDKEVGKAAEALVTVHPCLRELGSDTGWYGWKVSLKFKMGNFCSKLARSGCAEVSVNVGKRSKNNPDSDHPHSSIKRARLSEVNFLPNFPKGENQDTLKDVRLQIVQELEKAERNQVLIAKLMQTSFALRRQDIVKEDLPVKDILTSWPALRMESQVFAEFHRITNVNLRNQFYSELDRCTPRLIALLRQKALHTGKMALALRKLLETYDRQEENDVNTRRTLFLRALPIYLREDASEFFKTYNHEEEPDIADTPVALFTTGENYFSSDSFFLVVEGEVVVRDLPRLPDAFIVSFGLIYAFNLQYPKKLIHMFTFVQKVLMLLDDGKPLKPCVLNLKNELLKN
uniref:Sterile alpha motif domain-containing protein 3-like n=1 Tax=Astyanax mexicanus TaxID=7994 RepID=A0A3B1K613_ASTMX